LCASALVAVAHAADYYVSPRGNDTWSGTLAEPNAGATDGPFATLQRARDAIRKLKETENGLPGPVTVALRGGRYELAAPVVFDPRDSGAEGRPVTYCAYGNEKPVISGGVQVTGWRQHDDRLWVADAPRARDTERSLCQLFVNGVRRPRARTPNAGTYFYSKRLHLTDATHPLCLGLTYAKDDLGPWAGGDEALIVLFHNWVNSYNYIREANWERRRIRFARPAGIFFLGPSVRYYVENVPNALDAPGEWRLDRAEGALYYYPVPGEDMSRAEVIAPTLARNLVRFAGETKLGLFVERLVFRGLSFQHADPDLSRDYRHSVQGAVHQQGAIFAIGLRHTIFEDCEFTHLGEHAVSLRQGCAGNIVRRCHILDVGGGGVYLSEGAPQRPDETLLTSHNTVDNNFIHDGGHIFRAGVGVFLGGSASYNKITHNEICDLSWMGVHLGWSWTGRAPAYTHHNTVAYNHIHHLGNGVLNDIGGIYTLGVSPGTVLHHNLIHDITRFERGRQGYGGWGIYLDAGSSEIRVENNVVYNTRDGGFHGHCYTYPYGDVIVNNIFAYADDAELIRNADHDPEDSHLHLERNIVYGKTKRMYGGNSWKPEGKFTCDRNCYWSEAGEPDFYGKPLADWQAQGRDANSIVADPGFVDPGARDFRLRPGSPALALGFEPIDLGTVGLYGPESWTALPRTVTHRTYEEPPPPEEETGCVEADFDDYDVGERPVGAVAQEGNARVAVTDRDPASGPLCLQFVDAPGVTVWKPHWFARRTPGAGMVRLQCFVKNDPDEPAMFDLEFRDWPPGVGPKFATGPHVRFFPDGAVKYAANSGQAQWIALGTYELGKWLRVEVEFEEGEAKPKTWKVRFGRPGAAMTTRELLPFRHPAFRVCTWVGFAGMDEKRAAFYVDDLRLESRPSE